MNPHLEPVRLHAQSLTGLPCSIDDALRDWECVPLEFQGQLAACGIVRGTEIHFAAMPGFGAKIMTRRIIREFLGPLLARHGFLTTRTEPDDEAGRRFVERIGFSQTWQDPQYRYFIMTDLPFGRVPCQS